MTPRPRLRRLLLPALAVAVVGAVAAVGLTRWLGIGIGASAATAGPVPKYVDVTAASGISLTYDGGFDYAVGAGVAVLDCDGDGRPDLYLAGGAGPAGLFHNDSPPGGPIRFTQRHDPATDLTAVTGAYPIDVDGDGNVDLVVLRIGGNVVLRGLSDCRFERANEAWGLDGGTLDTMAFSATWESGASWPTIAFGNYVDQKSLDPNTWCETNQLIRPAASGTRRWAEPQPLTPSWCTLSLLFSSWDGTGQRVDLRVSNDRQYYPLDKGQEQLWRMQPGLPPTLYTAADGWSRVQVAGMGIASYDLTGDDKPEIYLTSQAANHLMTLADGATDPSYVDIGLARGTNVPHPVVGTDTAFPSTSWQPEFADVNNDGLIDLFVSKGNIGQEPDWARQDPSHLLLGQPDGTFVEATTEAGLVTFDKGRGAALVDLDGDGRLDLVESFYGSPVRIWQNAGSADGSTPPTHWLALRVHEPGPNTDAIGGVVAVTVNGQTQRRELTIGGGHIGGQLGWLHFGLGSADHAQVQVRWPDGSTSDPVMFASDGFTTIDREHGPQLWIPSTPP